jgi:predicted secreted protein
MKLGSILAIYFLFWVASAFLLLPFGVRTDEEMGKEKVPGQADSAPHRFDARKHAIRSTMVATILFALYYANWYFGWIGVEAFDFYNPS